MSTQPFRRVAVIGAGTMGHGIAQVTAAAEAQMAADRAQAMSTLTRQVGELSVELASKVVGESLSDDARVRSTVDAFLEDLERQASN